MANIIWTSSPDFKNLPNMCKGGNITLAELEIFIDMIAKNCASRLNLSQKETQDMIYHTNIDFYTLKDSIFKTGKEILKKDDEGFIQLCDLFKIPVNEERSKYMKTYLAGGSLSEVCKKEELKNSEDFNMENVIKALTPFYKLNKQEQIAFLIKLKQEFSLTLTLNDVFDIFEEK